MRQIFFRCVIISCTFPLMSSYIQKVGICGFGNPQIILNFPQKRLSENAKKCVLPQLYSLFFTTKIFSYFEKFRQICAKFHIFFNLIIVQCKVLLVFFCLCTNCLSLLLREKLPSGWSVEPFIPDSVEFGWWLWIYWWQWNCYIKIVNVFYTIENILVWY